MTFNKYKSILIYFDLNEIHNVSNAIKKKQRSIQFSIKIIYARNLIFIKNSIEFNIKLMSHFKSSALKHIQSVCFCCPSFSSSFLYWNLLIALAQVQVELSAIFSFCKPSTFNCSICHLMQKAVFSCSLTAYKRPVKLNCMPVIIPYRQICRKWIERKQHK